MSFWIHSFPFINYISNFRPSTKHKSPGRVEDRLELKSCSCVYFVVWIFHALCPCAAQNQIPRPHPQVTPAERLREWNKTKHTLKGISETFRKCRNLECLHYCLWLNLGFVDLSEPPPKEKKKRQKSELTDSVKTASQTTEKKRKTATSTSPKMSSISNEGKFLFI